ncbi:MAG TPA: phosphoribosylformylglycinamidine cyclo-ligase [Ktedonobacterales bacterium]|jgi:phosphoribosylformylglycinamidine cyclo-ligase
MTDAYAEAGVNIAAGDAAARAYAPHAARTWRPEVLTALGGFSGGFAVPIDRYPQPVLVSGTDGVGTKLKLAFALHRHDTIGIDCVAMCVNDVLVMGAEPLFFLDYFATGKLDPQVAEQVVRGVADGCAQAGCALIGGETAEMPGMYPEGEYDLAGFAVGIVNRDKMIDHSAIAAGDAVIGLASSGVHSNGFSLVRKLLSDAGRSLDEPFGDDRGVGTTLGETLLTPTRIYVKSVLTLLNEFPIHGMAHITGGGLTNNVPRMLSQRRDVELMLGSWSVPPIFAFLAGLGKLSDDELFQTFNMGVGFVLVVPAETAEAVIARAAELGECAYRIGTIRPGTGQVERMGDWRERKS